MVALDQVFEDDRHFHPAWAQFITCSLRSARFRRVENELLEMDRMSRIDALSLVDRIPWLVRRIEFLMRTRQYAAAIEEGQRLLAEMKSADANACSKYSYWDCGHVVAQAHFEMYRLHAEPAR